MVVDWRSQWSLNFREMREQNKYLCVEYLLTEVQRAAEVQRRKRFVVMRRSKTGKAIYMDVEVTK